MKQRNPETAQCSIPATYVVPVVTPKQREVDTHDTHTTRWTCSHLSNTNRKLEYQSWNTNRKLQHQNKQHNKTRIPSCCNALTCSQRSDMTRTKYCGGSGSLMGTVKDRLCSVLGAAYGLRSSQYCGR